MKKSNFITLVFGILEMLVFSIGMCMALLPEWNAFKEGVVCGCVGALCLLTTYILYRKNNKKDPIKLNGKLILKGMYVIFAVCVFGAGMSLTLLYEEHMLKGVIVGVIGILLCLGMIPLFKGFSE